MKYSIYDKMEICGHVRDKCCTVSDEIRITKLWFGRSEPILSAHADNTMHFVKSIFEKFWELAKLDPRLIILKYVVNKQIPYQYEQCNTYISEEDPAEHTKFVTYFDDAIQKQYNQHSITPKVVDTKKYTHDNADERHWGEKINPADEYFYMNKKYMAAEFVEDKVDYTHMDCHIKQGFFNKDFIVINKEKAKFCYNLYEKMLNFDYNKFKQYLRQVKSGLSRLVGYKKSFYCALCDAHEQKYFDVVREKFVLSHGFCRSLLHKNGPTIKFLNIIFIEFADFLMQFTECYETDAEIWSFPF